MNEVSEARLDEARRGTVGLQPLSITLHNAARGKHSADALERFDAWTVQGGQDAGGCLLLDGTTTGTFANEGSARSFDIHWSVPLLGKGAMGVGSSRG